MSQFQEPAWISESTSQNVERERAFFRSVYGWMFGGLLLTALASFAVASSPMLKAIVIANPIVWIALMIAELGLVFYAGAKLRTMSPTTAAAVFLIYSLLTGLTLSIILFVYTRASVVQAFASAAAMFAAMSVYGRITRRNLTGWGQFLIMGVVGLIVVSVINMFVHSTALEMAIASIGVFIFAGLTAYKTQSLRQFAYVGGTQGETLAIYGALSLYITFINLFISLLRLFGNRR